MAALWREVLELEEAIGRYAHGVWKLADNGPHDVPDRYEDLAEELKRPYGGRPAGGNCTRRAPPDTRLAIG